MAYRRVIIATSEWAAVVWAKRHAKSTFLLLWSDCEGLTIPFELEVAQKCLVEELPLSPATLGNTATVVFYGRYGEFGTVVRWDELGQKLPELSKDDFLPPADIKNISGTFIGHDTSHMLRLNPRKRS